MKRFVWSLGLSGLALGSWAAENLPAAQYRILADYHIASKIVENCPEFAIERSESSIHDEIVASLSAQGWNDVQILTAITNSGLDEYEDYILSYTAGLDISVSPSIDYCEAGRRSVVRGDEVSQYLKDAP